MNTITIVETLNKIEDFDSCRVEIDVRVKVNLFFFEDCVESFHGSIIERTGFCRVRHTHIKTISRVNVGFGSIYTELRSVKNLDRSEAVHYVGNPASDRLWLELQ